MKRIFILILMTFMSLSVVSADLNQDITTYWSLNNTMTDATGNGNTLTNNGASYTPSGKNAGAFDFDGNNDYISTSLNFPRGDDWTLSFWLDPQDYTARYDYFSELTTNTGRDGLLIGQFDGQLRVVNYIGNSAADYFQESGATLQNDWQLITLVFDDSNNQLSYYYNGQFQLNSTFDQLGTFDRNIIIGTDNINFFNTAYDGKIDEISLWEKALNPLQINDLYNSGSGLFYPFPIEGVAIETNLTNFYNSENISIQLNTTTLTNMSYILDSGSEVSICNNCNSSILNLYDLSEGFHTIVFISENENGQVNTTRNFTIDTTPPTITNNIPTEINSYEFDVNSFASCNSAEICNISFSEDGTTIDLPYNINQTLAYTGNFYNTVGSGFRGITTDGSFIYRVTSAEVVYIDNLDGTYTGTSFSVSSEMSAAEDIAFNGTHLFVLASNPDFVFVYTKSGTYTGTSYTVAPQDSTPRGLTYYDDKFYMSGDATDTVYEYDNTFSTTGFSFSTSSQDVQPWGISKNENFFYIVGATTDYIYQYDNSGSYTGLSLDISAQTISPQGVVIIDNNILVGGDDVTKIYNYTLPINKNINYTFTNNGNQNYIINAEDLAGNSVQANGSLLVNPEITLQVRDIITNNTLSNFQLGEFNSVGENLTINIFDLGIGEHTLLFRKEGYNLENMTFTFTNQSSGVITLYANPVTIFARAFDGETLTQLTNFDIEIKNETDVVTFSGVNNLSKQFNEIPTGDIEIRFSKSTYSDALFYTTTTPFSSVTFDVYLTPVNLSSIITFTLTDLNTRQFLDGVTIEARRSVINDTVTIQQTKTGSTGVGFLILDELKNYEYIFSKEGYTQAIIEAIPGVTNYNVRLNQETQTFNFLNGVNIRYFPQTPQLYKNTTYNFTTQVTGDSITRVEYLLLNSNGEVLDSINTTNPTGATFITPFFINENYNSTSIKSQIKVFINGQEFTNSKEFKIAGSLGGVLLDLKNFGNSDDEEFKFIKFFIVVISYIITIVIGNRNPITRDYVSALSLLPTVIFTWLGWIPLLYGTVITIAIIVLYVGGNKRN